MRLLRLLHALLPTALVVAIVAPTLPTERFGPAPGAIARVLLQVSVKEVWGMYAPDPQRAQTYMELVAEYRDGRVAGLEENDELANGWGTHWAWDKTRMSIWRHYANYHPDSRNDNRTWYLRMVCVREARRGDPPVIVRMFQVKRRFGTPRAVAHGGPSLSEAERKLVTLAYCESGPVKQMIDLDRARRPESDG